MSADNCIAILKTTDNFIKENEYTLVNTFGKGIIAYRVAHIQAVDNFQYYLENEIHNLGAYLQSEFGNSEVFYSKEKAYHKAGEILDSIYYVEYGIIDLDASKYNFPGC